jgi:hypothetical protein
MNRSIELVNSITMFRDLGVVLVTYEIVKIQFIPSEKEYILDRKILSNLPRQTMLRGVLASASSAGEPRILQVENISDIETRAVQEDSTK